MSKGKKIARWFEQNIPSDILDSTLFKFRIYLGPHQENPIDIDMSAELDVDYTLVQEQLADLPAQFAWWAAIYSELKMQVGVYEKKIKLRRSRLINAAIAEAKESGVRLTDKQLSSISEDDATLNELDLVYIRLQKYTGKMYYMIKAMEMKFDALRSLAGFARLEQEHNSSI